MKLLRKLTNKEWKEIGEKYKDGGVYNYRGKKTFFYNGEKLWEGDEDGNPLVYKKRERQTWEVIIVLPGVEVIPELTFSSCMNIKTVIMSDTVKRIENGAFQVCTALVFVKLSANLEFIGFGAFFDCKYIPSIFVPPSCREIGDCAFYRCTSLIVLQVPQHTQLGQRVIADTALILNSPFETDDETGEYENDVEVNKWIKNRHEHFPLHNLCCDEGPTFGQSSIIPTKEECYRQDDCRLTPLIYLIYNNTADYDTVEQMVKIGGKEVLFLEDRYGLNALQWACYSGDEATMRLLVRIGGRELVNTLESEKLTEDQKELYRGFMTSSNIESALLLHDYTNAIHSSESEMNIDQMINTILDSRPSYHQVIEIMSIQGIPHEHHRKLQEYSSTILEKELELFTEKQEKVPLMRSTITVVGRGRDGKTSTINSLKGLPFQQYCESTKGAETSEVDVHDVGIHVTSIEASGIAFKEAERDPFNTKRCIAKELSETGRDFNSGPTDEGNKSKPISDEESHPKKRRKVTTMEAENAKEVDASKRKGDSEFDSTNTPAATIMNKLLAIMNTCLGRSPDLSNIENENDQIVEETDKAEKKADMNLGTTDGNSIRFTIYDNGGQRVFRSIQNLLLSRNGIFVVVFNMMNLIGADTAKREEAIEHLNYWLSSIKVDASKDSEDLSIRYPPVILVGTHYDQFQSMEGDLMTRLKDVDKLLRKKLPIKDLVPLSGISTKSLQDSREFLYNKAQNLSFWPIDNSDPNDENIKTIRNTLLTAATSDKGFDITEEVPISFLRAMDKLTELSEENPIVPITSNEPDQPSVMNIMQDCGVFEDATYKGQEEIDTCKAILKRYHSIGHFIYFSQEGLYDYCIVDPQWLIDMITYVVRDFKLHRFRRDFKAMALNDGESWKSLLNQGFLDGALLRMLWLDREHETFLTKLMLELGIFGQLQTNTQDFCQNLFTVPTTTTILSSESMVLSKPKIENHLDVKRIDDATKKSIKMSDCIHNMVPFYGRLVNRLVSEWSNGYNLDQNRPDLLPCASNLCLGKDYKFSILINEDDFSLDILSTANDEKMSIILKYVIEGCKYVNERAYKSCLQLGYNFEVSSTAIYRNMPSTDELALHIQSVNFETKEVINMPHNLVALSEFLDNENLAQMIHVFDNDITPEELVENYYGDKDEFEKDFLGEMGMNFSQKKRIVKILDAKESPPQKLEKYAIFNFLDEKDLCVKDEEKAITTRLIASYFDYKIFRDRNFEELHTELTKHPEYKIVHFGMHASSIDTFITSTLASRLEKSHIKCIFLNICESEAVASDLRTNAKIENVAFWSSKVDDSAAMAFSEAFYHFLCMKKRANFENFKEAFEFAKERVQLRNFVLIDPIANVDELEKRKREVGRPDLVAAGIPVFYYSSNEQIIDPIDCEVMISFNNATGGKDAEELCHFLNRNGKKTFCTRVFCPNNMGDWRKYTEIGACKCKIFIVLMTNGWQTSDECQIETSIIKTRLARNDVNVIPVYYSSFDEAYDKETNKFYRLIWASYQGIPNKESDDKWMESVLKLFRQ